MRTSVVSCFAAVLLCAGLIQAAQSQDATTQEPGTFQLGSPDQNFDPSQPIKAGFTVSVTVSSAAGPEQDLTGVFQVDPTGAIQMKLIGRVELRALTPPQGSDKIAALLKPYLRDPKVAVTIIAVPRPVIFMGGGTGRTGAISVNDGTTLSDVLTIYGFNDNADLSKVRVIHRDDKGVRTTKEYDFTRWLKPLPGERPDELQNPVLGDRDIIFLPLKIIPATGNVTVEGAVARPGLVPIRVGVPTQLREVLSLAGGALQDGDARSVSVRRLGAERPLTFDYDRMEQGDPFHNISMQADDVVYVRKLDPDHYVNLTGAFIRAGRATYQKEMTLTQLIGDAGGVAPFAKEKEGRIFRHPNGSADPTKTQIIAFNWKKIKENKEPDILLQPNDTVDIPQGSPPRPGYDWLQLATSLFTLAILLDRLTSRRQF